MPRAAAEHMPKIGTYVVKIHAATVAMGLR
jgi:hypothetical protein